MTWMEIFHLAKKLKVGTEAPYQLDGVAYFLRVTGEWWLKANLLMDAPKATFSVKREGSIVTVRHIS